MSDSNYAELEHLLKTREAKKQKKSQQIQSHEETAVQLYRHLLSMGVTDFDEACLIAKAFHNLASDLRFYGILEHDAQKLPTN